MHHEDVNAHGMLITAAQTIARERALRRFAFGECRLTTVAKEEWGSKERDVEGDAPHSEMHDFSDEWVTPLRFVLLALAAALAFTAASPWLPQIIARFAL